MKRLLVAAAMLGAVAGAGAPARADSICVSSGLTIMGEPWLSHQQCVPCPTVDCFWIPVQD